MALKLEPIHSHGEPDLDGDIEIKHDDDAHVDPFNMVYSWTLDIPVSLAARGLFVYLMDWAGNKKKTWHRRKRMAAAVGVSPRTLHKYLHELEDQGLIWFEHRKAEGKPSMCHISGKARVVQRQQILSLGANKDPMQNLQEVAPLAKSARPPRKDCKTPSQNLQQNKDIRSTHMNKTDEPGVGADKPRRAPSTRSTSSRKQPDLERVSTEIDPDAPPARRLALDLAYSVIKWDSIGTDTLKRYERLYGVRLALPFPVEDYDDAELRLMAFNGWLESNGFWEGKGYMLSDSKFAAEWNDWVGSGEPAEKRRSGKQQSSIGRAYRDANGGA